jgi:chromosome segregation ATPase
MSLTRTAVAGSAPAVVESNPLLTVIRALAGVLEFLSTPEAVKAVLEELAVRTGEAEDAEADAAAGFAAVAAARAEWDAARNAAQAEISAGKAEGARLVADANRTMAEAEAKRLDAALVRETFERRNAELKTLADDVATVAAKNTERETQLLALEVQLGAREKFLAGQEREFAAAEADLKRKQDMLAKLQEALR